MKRLTSPAGHDDYAKLQELKSYTKTNISSVISSWILTLEAQYNAYDSYVASPFSTTTGITEKSFAKLLRETYTSPPLPLKECIDNLREKGSPDVCPMCGSLKTGTLDHYFPKGPYPEYSFFFKNLVPACDCNIKRSTNLIGNAPFERVLHPYYNDCLMERIVTSTFSGDMGKPLIDIKALPSSKEHIETIEFHIDKILRRMPIIAWLENEWIKILRMPREIILTLPQGTVSTEDVFNSCLTRLNSFDREYGTPNNWRSIFFHGLTNHPAAIEKIRDVTNQDQPFNV